MSPLHDRDDIRYDDDFDVAPGRQSRQDPTNAGLIGFIAAVVSLGLLVVVVILYIFLQHEEQQGHNAAHDERVRWMYYWFLFLDVVSFLAALTATIAAGRGLAPSNALHRGWAVAALVLGIIEMLITIGFGLFMTCCVILLEAFRRPGG
jgi:uncharacterized BrkB/YihY/UPF0761 family membrane protein